MKRIAALCIAVAALWGGQEVNGIALKVDGEIVTMGQIRQEAARLKITPKEAAERLIRQRIEAAEKAKFGVHISDAEIEEAIAQVATRNNLTIMRLRDAVTQGGMSWDVYRTSIKEELERDRLTRQIAQSVISSLDERELRRFYETHLAEYSLPGRVEAIQYASKNREHLEVLAKNPLMAPPAEVVREELALDMATLAPKLQAIIAATPEGGFTPVMPVEDQFLTLFVRTKGEFKPRPFDEVKNAIFARLSAERQNDVVKDYFDKRRASAKIVYLRTL